MVSLTYGIQTVAQMNPSMKQKQTHRRREQTQGCHGGDVEEGRIGSLGVADATLYIC